MARKRATISSAGERRSSHARSAASPDRLRSSRDTIGTAPLPGRPATVARSRSATSTDALCNTATPRNSRSSTAFSTHRSR
ncbi:hypothetical protein [Saccharothrix obliqua]|uniref:hypothetical protein n=1 Tax=Saccharothrix obliqua TaxID=2861747 RepID=UPI001C5D6EBE|nr:hypothetical protein [Saccharothrix obliqua]MBW4719957.1 hypothetical protein [Saccharothrix obliqua]